MGWNWWILPTKLRLKNPHRRHPPWAASPTMYPLHWAASVTLDIDHDPSGPSGYGPLSLLGVRFKQRWETKNRLGMWPRAPSKLCISKQVGYLMVVGSCSTEITGQSMLIISNESKYRASAARRKEHTAQWPSTAAATTLLLGSGTMKTWDQRICACSFTVQLVQIEVLWRAVNLNLCQVEQLRSFLLHDAGEESKK